MIALQALVNQKMAHMNSTCSFLVTLMGWVNTTSLQYLRYPTVSSVFWESWLLPTFLCQLNAATDSVLNTFSRFATQPVLSTEYLMEFVLKACPCTAQSILSAYLGFLMQMHYSSLFPSMHWLSHHKSSSYNSPTFLSPKSPFHSVHLLVSTPD